MLRNNRFLSIPFVIALLLSACQPIQAPAAEPSRQAEVLIQGPALRAPETLAMYADGTLAASDYYGRAIVRINPTTGKILERLGPEQGIDIPGNIAISADDVLYWTQWGSNELCRRTVDGSKQCQVIDDNVGPLGFDSDGRLFAAAGDKFYAVDLNLATPPVLVTTIDGWIVRFAFGPDGMVYLPDSTHEVIVSADLKVTPPVTKTITAAAGLPWISAVMVDAQGQLYAAISYDETADGIVRVDPASGATEEVWHLSPPGLVQPIRTKDGRLFVGDIHNGTVYELLPEGKLRAIMPLGMVAPGGLAVVKRADGGESLYVADTLSVREFDGATGAARDVIHINAKAGALTFAATVAADGENLIVTSAWTGAVQLYNPHTHTQLALWQEPLNGAVNALRFQADLVVAEAGAKRVVRMTTSEPVTTTVLAENIEVPAGLATDGDNVWVSDYGTGKVLQIIAHGAPLTPSKVVAADLKQPEGLAVTPDGRLLIAETGTDRLLAVDLQSGKISTLAQGLGFTTQNPTPAIPYAYWLFNGVAVGPSGTIYVSGDKANVIYRIPATTR